MYKVKRLHKAYFNRKMIMDFSATTWAFKVQFQPTLFPLRMLKNLLQVFISVCVLIVDISTYFLTLDYTERQNIPNKDAGSKKLNFCKMYFLEFIQGHRIRTIGLYCHIQDLDTKSRQTKKITSWYNPSHSQHVSIL